jgi:hypothetical protein
VTLTRIPGTWVGIDLDVLAKAWFSEFIKRYEAGGEEAVEKWMQEVLDCLSLEPSIFQTKLRDQPKTFSGGKMQEPIIFENTSLYGGNNDHT